MPPTAIRTAARRAHSTVSSSIQATTIVVRHASSSSSFTPALPQGQNPAYDAALSYLSEHTSKVQSRLADIQSSASEAEIQRLEIAALVNDPATRRQFRESGSGKGHMDSTIMRHLAEREWIQEGGLDLLMQRVHQMGVVPDILPSVGRTQPMTIRLSGQDSPVVPGTILPAELFAQPPRITVQLFQHPSTSNPTSNPSKASSTEGKFTLVILDADAPVPETHSFTQRVLYWKDDIPLSVMSGETDLFDSSLGVERLSYNPPTPEKGTGKHRYVALVFPTSSTTTDVTRQFDVRSYLAALPPSSRKITAISLFRSIYTPESSSHIRAAYAAANDGAEMPEYGKPPIEARFGYPPTATQQRQAAIREEAVQEALGGLMQEIEQLDVEGKDK